MHSYEPTSRNVQYSELKLSPIYQHMTDSQNEDMANQHIIIIICLSTPCFRLALTLEDPMEDTCPHARRNRGFAIDHATNSRRIIM